MSLPDAAPAPTRLASATLNHVSIPAVDLDRSEAFYVEVFGLARVPAPNFGFPVRWLRLGDLQLHLQTIDAELGRRSYQHFGISVPDLTATYKALRARGAFEPDGRYAALWLLPSGELQLFARDPAANLIEVDCRGVAADALAALGADVRILADEEPQGPEHCSATLFLTP